MTPRQKVASQPFLKLMDEWEGQYQGERYVIRSSLIVFPDMHVVAPHRIGELARAYNEGRCRLFETETGILFEGFPEVRASLQEIAILAGPKLNEHLGGSTGPWYFEL